MREGKSFEEDVSVPTIKSWLSILEASYVLFQLQPYYANIGKRLTKTPKLYFYRDQRQHEVDLLEEQPDGRLHAYEIKAGMTFRQDYFTQLTYLKEVLGDKLIKSQVIYDGSQEKSQSTNGIINFRNIGG